MKIAEAPEWLLNSLPQRPTDVPDVPRERLTLNGHAKDGGRPGDAFNAAHTWEELLESYGWTLQFSRGEEAFWRRPGKSEGVSATTNYKGADVFYPFTTSTEFQANRSYDRFGVYAVMEHGGDFRAAASRLGEEGYGEQLPELRGIRATYIEETARDAIEAEYPSGYRFTPIFPRGHFIGEFVAYVKTQASVAGEYTEAMGLALLASTMPGIRCGITPDAEMSANLYGLLIGESSIAHKSTILKLSGRILDAAVPGVRLPESMTPEGLRDVMASRPSQASSWFKDEFGKLFRAIKRQGYLSGLEDYILQLYDGDSRSFKKATKREKQENGKTEVVKDEVEIKHPHFTFVGGATPDLLRDMSMRDIEDGMLPRFAVIWPAEYPPPDPRGVVRQEDVEWRQQLIGELQERIKWQEQFRPGVVWTESAMETLNAFEVKMKRRPETVLRRFGDMVWKLAMLAAWGGEGYQGEDLIVSDADAELAMAVIERWTPGQLRFAEQIGGRSPREQEITDMAERVMAFIRVNGGGIEKRVIWSHFHLSGNLGTEIEKTLRGQGRMDVGKMVPEKPDDGKPHRSRAAQFWGTPDWIDAHAVPEMNAENGP